MENIIITKVRNKNGQECNVNWNLNLEKRMIENSLVTNFMIKEILEIMDKYYADYLHELRLKLSKNKNISKYRKVYLLAKIMRCEDEKNKNRII